MNKVRLFIASLLTTLIITSCEQTPSSFISLAEAESVIPGDWKVFYYGDASGSDTAPFDGYTFTFKDDGTLTAVSGETSYDGTWTVAISMDDVYDQELTMTVDQMDLINHTWLLYDMSETAMRMIDESSPQEIHFLKQ